MSFFEILHKDAHSEARTGIMHTDHGDIQTPVFMPVGTQATVKSLDSADIAMLDAEIILANTYHLHLRPGEDVIQHLGGLHKFMHWDRPILTDSGGFQVFSLQSAVGPRTTDLPVRQAGYGLRTTACPDASIKTNRSLPAGQAGPNAKLVSIDDDGVTFQSHIDGSTHRFTPESAIDMQHKLGADIIMAFDEATPDSASESYAREAMERTHHWAERCLNDHKSKIRNPKSEIRNFLFGIIQGAGHKALREESARHIGNLDFDGIAIGGESIGYHMGATKRILSWVMPLIPKEKPHYTMGVGLSPMDLFDVVEYGIDMFDCVSPTRIARNGTLYTREHGSTRKNRYTINITNAAYREDAKPIDPTCTCPTCKNYSRAYVHHLFRAEELLAYRLATIHNLHFLLSMMKDMRQAIQEDRFLEMKEEWSQ